MDKQLFDDAIGEVPPSTVDVDAAIARGRRAAWTRRVANPVVAAAAAVVLVAGGAVVLTLPDGEPVTAAQVQPTTTRTDPPRSPAAACTANPVALGLTEALSAALESRGLLVGAALSVDPTITELNGPGTAPLQFLPLELEVTNGCGGYSAVGVVDGTGRLTVSVARLDDNLIPEMECLPKMGDCQRTTGPNGEGIVGFANWDANRVDIVKGDTVVILAAENHRGGVAPPLTREQLTDLGLDPGLTLGS